MSSMMKGHEARSAAFFFTAAFLTMVIFMRSLQKRGALRNGIKGSTYRMCSMATSTSQGRTAIFLITVFFVLFMSVFSSRPLN